MPKTPHVKLPHFIVTWDQFGPVSLPSVSIQWYRKAMGKAMVLDDPTLFGYSAATGNLLAGGESGREVVSGEAHLVGLIGDVVAEQNRELYGYIGQLSRAISAMEPVINVMVGNKEFDSYIVEKSMDGISRMTRMTMAGHGL